jgi:hypothetical protein
MKRIVIFLLVCLLIGCVTKHRTQNNIFSFKIEAQYTPYITAMGKGKGIIFKINISNIASANLQIDSLYVNGKAMNFVIKKKNETLFELEANYLKTVQELGFLNDSKNNQVNEIKDELIVNHQFYPSWIVVINNHQKINILIENYKLIE